MTTENIRQLEGPTGNLGHYQGELAILLGFILFCAVYAFVWRLRRSLYGEEAADDR